MFYIDTDYIKSIFKNTDKRNIFVNLTPGTEIRIPIFLFLKRSGISKYEFNKYDEKKVKEALFLLSCPFSSKEEHLENFYLINPYSKKEKFNMKQSCHWVKATLEKYASLGGNGVPNIYTGGGNIWKLVLDVPPGGKSPIRFRPDYVDELVKMVGIEYGNKINITRLAAWTLREKAFPAGLSDYELTEQAIEEFIGFFNITNYELKQMFEITGERILFSKNPPDMKILRENCFYLNGTDKISTDPLIDYKQIIIKRKRVFMSRNPSLDDIYKALEINKQIILYGPPGGGKTYIAKQIAEDKFKDSHETVQFHQNYGYEHFIGGYFPKESQGQKSVDIEYKEGLLLRAVDTSETKKFLLFIDEINRGNISKIFGETLITLDRDYKDILINSHPKLKKLGLPDNLYIIGTMNSTDRSIALVDFALRRRFFFIKIVPDVEEIRKYYDSTSKKTKIEDNRTKIFDLIDLFNEINERIAKNQALGSEFKIGHTYFFLDKDPSKNRFELFESQFNYSIYPLIEEYSYGNPTLLEDILGKDLSENPSGHALMDAIIKYLNLKRTD